MAPPLVDDLPENVDVAFDTNSLIYLVERNPKYLQVVESVFAKTTTGVLRGHASVVSLIEVLIKPVRDGNDELADEYKTLLRSSLGFTLHDVTAEVSERAADVRARWNLRVPDAIVAATALASGCTHIVTNDPDFKRVEGFRALVIEDYLREETT